MKNLSSSQWTIIIIGALSMLSGILLAFSDGPSNKALFGIAIGISMIGSAYSFDSQNCQKDPV